MKKDSKLFLRRSDGSDIPLCASKDSDFDALSQSGFPGSFPFTRGVQPTMYRGRLWTMRQYAGFGTAKETNQRFQKLLAAGQTGLSVAFDLPTQMGFDSDHPMAQGEVGRVGVAISSLEDMETLFQGIPLSKVSTSMTINSTAAILLCFYLALAKKQGSSFFDLRGTIQNDVLKEYIARGTYIYTPSHSLRLVTDLIAYCSEHVPKWNPISISGYHIREAGSDAVQEVAFTLANAKEYSKSVLARGLSFDDFAGQLSFFFTSHNDFIEEVAKFRAARRLWARMASETFGAKKQRSKLLRFHVQTAGSTLTAQQPNNNIVRVTLQALAAILGGCQSLHTNSRDEALSLPSEASALLALRTQQILAEESGVVNTVDPLGGSYLLENETTRIERSARILLEEIDRLGGSASAIEQGYFQKAIAERSYQVQQEIEKNERRVVGLNAYQTEEISASSSLKMNPVLETTRRKDLNRFRKERNAPNLHRSLTDLASAAKSSTNLVPFILKAAEARATVGEISDVLREVFGTYQPHQTHV